MAKKITREFLDTKTWNHCLNSNYVIIDKPQLFLEESADLVDRSVK